MASVKQSVDFLILLVMYNLSFHDKIFLWFAGLWTIIYILTYFLRPLIKDWLKKRKAKKEVK